VGCARLLQGCVSCACCGGDHGGWVVCRVRMRKHARAHTQTHTHTPLRRKRTRTRSCRARHLRSGGRHSARGGSCGGR
jgi:hypothetical protein